MKKKWIIILVAGLVGLGLVWLLTEQFSIEKLIASEQQLRHVIARHPVRAMLITLLIYFLVSLVPGTSGKTIVCGWFLGFWPGVVISELGLTLAALTSFVLSRYVFRAAVERRLHRYLDSLNAALERDGAFYLITLRLFHVPFSLVNYGAGASRIRASTFAWTTALGLLPGTIVFVFAGTQVPTLSDLATHGAKPLGDPLLITALLAMGLVPLAIRWLLNTLHRLFDTRKQKLRLKT